MKFKVLFILAGVSILHGVVLTGICLTGGCNSTPVLEPRPFIPAPESPDTGINDKVVDDKAGIPEFTIKNQPDVPATPAAPEFKLDTPPQEIVYTVQKNDSFWKIARKHGVSMQNLAAYNDMPLNKALRVGQKLRIPPGGYVAKNPPPVPKATSKVKKAKPLSRPSDGTYVVKSGDSFWKIAKRYNLKTKTLLDANNMTGKEVLQVGQKLIIPDGKKAPVAVSGNVPKAVDADKSVGSILDTVDSPDDAAKIDDSAAKPVAPPASVKKLIDDTGAENTESIGAIDDGDRAVQVIKDIRVEDFAKQYKVTPAILKKLNDDYPADGVFKAGSVVIVRTAE